MHCLSPSSVLMWALMWVLMWILMCVLMCGPHVSPYVSPQNPSASSHTPHTTTSALSGLVASVCALCVLCVSVCALLLSGLPGQETKLNIKSTKNILKNITKILDFRTQTSSILGPILIYPASLAPTCNTHLFFDRQTTDFLLTDGPQNGPKIS